MNGTFTSIAAFFAAQQSIGATPEPPPPPAAIVVYVPAGEDSTNLICPIAYAGSDLVDLVSGTYVDWRVPGGAYRLAAGSAQIEVDASAGTFTYIRCSAGTGSSAELKLEVVETGGLGELVGDLGTPRTALLNLFNRRR